MTPAVWVIPAVVVCLGSGLGMVRFVTMDRRARHPVRVVTQCDLDGHGLRFRSSDLQWSCATCGEKLSRDGDFFDQINSVGASAPSVTPTGREFADLGHRSGRLLRH